MKDGICSRTPAEADLTVCLDLSIWHSIMLFLNWGKLGWIAWGRTYTLCALYGRKKIMIWVFLGLEINPLQNNYKQRKICPVSSQTPETQLNELKRALHFRHLVNLAKLRKRSPKFGRKICSSTHSYQKHLKFLLPEHFWPVKHSILGYFPSSTTNT